jgi:hypothetical protein
MFHSFVLIGTYAFLGVDFKQACDVAYRNPPEMIVNLPLAFVKIKRFRDP